MTRSLVVMDRMDKFKRRDTTIGSKKPTPTNLTTSFGTEDFILGNGVYVPGIDMSIFWDRLQGLNLDDQRLRSMAELFYRGGGVNEAKKIDSRSSRLFLFLVRKIYQLIH